jgi:hypothetical protein
MHSLRLRSAALLFTALTVAACDGSGGHNTPDESDQATGADSASAGTEVSSTLPPEGTANPAPGGTGSYPDSAPPTALGQSQGATPGSANPAAPVQSGAASDSSR